MNAKQIIISETQFSNLLISEKKEYIFRNIIQRLLSDKFIQEENAKRAQHTAIQESAPHQTLLTQAKRIIPKYTKLIWKAYTKAKQDHESITNE